MANFKSKKHAEEQLKKARQEYSKLHKELLATSKPVRLAKQANDERALKEAVAKQEVAQKKSDAALKACEEIRTVLDRWY